MSRLTPIPPSTTVRRARLNVAGRSTGNLSGTFATDQSHHVWMAETALPVEKFGA